MYTGMSWQLAQMNTSRHMPVEQWDWLWPQLVVAEDIIHPVPTTRHQPSDSSAVTVSEPKPEDAVFCQNCGEPKLKFFGAKWIWFRRPKFVFITHSHGSARVF